VLPVHSKLLQDLVKCAAHRRRISRRPFCNQRVHLGDIVHTSCCFWWKVLITIRVKQGCEDSECLFYRAASVFENVWRPAAQAVEPCCEQFKQQHVSSSTTLLHISSRSSFNITYYQHGRVCEGTSGAEYSSGVSTKYDAWWNILRYVAPCIRLRMRTNVGLYLQDGPPSAAVCLSVAHTKEDRV
jgi:hypothetical protein